MTGDPEPETTCPAGVPAPSARLVEAGRAGGG